MDMVSLNVICLAGMFFFHLSQTSANNPNLCGEGTQVIFTVDFKGERPRARNVRPYFVSVEHASVSPLPPPGLGPVPLKRCLLRACASCRADSAVDVVRILDLRADPNARDVTSHRALMVAALNPRNSEQKCRILVQYGADPTALYTSDVSVLEWVHDCLSPEFASFLLKLHTGESVNARVAMELPRNDEY